MEWFFIGHDFNITMFKKENHNLFLSFKIIVKFHRQDSLPTHIPSIGRLISDKWRQKTLSSISALSKELKFVPF